MRPTTLCKKGWDLGRMGPIPLKHPAPASRSIQDSYVSKGGPLGDLGPSVLFGDSQTTPGPFYRAVQVDRSDLKMFHHFLSSLELRRPSSTNFCIMKAS